MADAEVLLPMLTFFDLPHEDVIFVRILLLLSLQDLFLCRRVCRSFKEVVDSYFKVCRKIDCSGVANRLTRKAFVLMTRYNTNLQGLNVAYCKRWLDQDALIRVLGESSRLQMLDLTGCSTLSNQVLFTLTAACRSIRSLYLRECRWVSCEAITQISHCCTELEIIDLGGCWEVVDLCVISLVSFCSKLRVLTLNDCYSLTDDSVVFIARNCSRLQHLGLKSCWRVTNSSINLVGEYCRHLNSLEVLDCRDINEISLARIRVRGVHVDVEPTRTVESSSDDRGWPRPFSRLNLQI